MPDAAHLRRAGDLLADASESAEGDAADRLRDLGDTCHDLADRARGPDHGRLARLLNALGEVEPDLDDEGRDRLEEARSAISTYREDVEGV